MPDVPLVAHSPTEACLFLLVTPCSLCHKGPVEDLHAHTVNDRDAGAIVTVEGTCSACGGRNTHSFRLAQNGPSDEEVDPPQVNRTDSPSRIIDVAQWLTLFRMMREEAGKESDKVQARQLEIEAGQCLDEALKFYDDADNDLPREEAFFGDESLGRFRNNPQQYSRQRLIDLKSQLPARLPSTLRGSSQSVSKRRWWRWRK
ncbi:MAG: hypothetical protein JSU63_11685 [Phycisphaerales bacterium]|nr:MAG: hypothetical protein JSU63_11685 [Phycisphaerales bacterium]